MSDDLKMREALLHAIDLLNSTRRLVARSADGTSSSAEKAAFQEMLQDLMSRELAARTAEIALEADACNLPEPRAGLLDEIRRLQREVDAMTGVRGLKEVAEVCRRAIELCRWATPP